ncbi:putative v-snare microsporum canis [Golovinomyces cichoracearum]|uniref:Putative v-snare microsporum canis n=1 Tax=Golovinomyces cichoracearum TaxID=62708 RepID=A0A420J9E0_9PEZI|nr:putative v-snare microsporum canis [Golovinomyces cichoracearum]
MATSRKRDAEPSTSIYSNKSRCRPGVEARINPTYGQRSALPGLDGEAILADSDEELEKGDHDSIEALAYLASVRQEAIGIPNVLYAPNNQTKTDIPKKLDDQHKIFHSKYEDGAYLSISDPSDEPNTSCEDSSDGTSLECFSSILSRYKYLRNCLHKRPQTDLVQNLKPYQRTQVGPLNKDTSKWWIGHMKNSDPNPVQIASMDKNTVLRLLGLLTQGTVLKSGLKVAPILSRWAWSLLARLPDRGDLNSEEIGVLRALGKKAISLGMSLKEDSDWGSGLTELGDSFDNNAEDSYVSDLITEDETYEEQNSINDAEVYETEISTSENLLEVGPEEHNTETIHSTLDTKQEEPAILSRQGSIEIPDNDSLSKDLVDSSPKHSESKCPEDGLLAAKARILERYCGPENEDSINIEPEILPEPVSKGIFSPSPLQQNAQATVDMILTIVGESYGQRDLLEFRGCWDSEN